MDHVFDLAPLLASSGSLVEGPLGPARPWIPWILAAACCGLSVLVAAGALLLASALLSRRSGD